jgi:hypothetical protein
MGYDLSFIGELYTKYGLQVLSQFILVADPAERSLQATRTLISRRRSS